MTHDSFYSSVMISLLGKSLKGYAAAIHNNDSRKSTYVMTSSSSLDYSKSNFDSKWIASVS